MNKKHENNSDKSFEETNAQLLKRIKELEAALRYERMRSDAYNTMIDIAEKQFNIEIRTSPDDQKHK